MCQASDLIGELTNGLVQMGFESVSALQVESWKSQISVLQRGIKEAIAFCPEAAQAVILFEYTIPVIRRRLDAVILYSDKVVVIEYKQGRSTSAVAALRQAQDYALDLADFHEHCRDVQIFPIALGEFGTRLNGSIGKSGAAISPNDLSNALVSIFKLPATNRPINELIWAKGRYFPVPLVVEAAVAAFNGHSVANIAISRSDPGSLERSKRVLIDAVATAQESRSKLLCVLTGVPGAGKTLTGLNGVAEVVSNLKLETEQAVYLSGNKPLVNVLREALYRNRKERGEKVTKAKLEVLIQEMHRFVQDTYELGGAPVARMIVFDEAQRAWSRERNIRKFGRNISEPSMILEIMDRLDGWAVVVALVGGGQEIHEGEAGLEEWGRAISKFPNWRVWASPAAMDGGPAVAGTRLFPRNLQKTPRVVIRQDLHLNVSLRSIDSEASAEWVNVALECNRVAAAKIATRGLPIHLCRNCDTLRQWLRKNQLGSRRTGLVASSAAERLRAIGVETPAFSFMRGIDYVKWFLEPEGDVRSSNQLEVALSEFEVQGLEIDFVGLIWGGDLVYDHRGLMVRKFSGAKWIEVGTTTNHLFDPPGREQAIREGLNRYRVLMTRYRKAMMICVPEGDLLDATRSPTELDSVYEYLHGCGLKSVD